MNRTKIDKLRSNVATLLLELDNEYVAGPDTIISLATRIYELADGDRLTAADALAIASAKAENALMALLDILEEEGFYTFSELGTARAALRELAIAIHQYESMRK